MKNLLQFVKMTLAGGFFVVLPVVLIGMLLADTIDILVGLIRPVAELFPAESLGGIGVAKVVAVVFLLIICFVVGLLMRTALGSRLGRRFERKVLTPIPGYQLIKSISQRFAGADAEQFAPCLVESADGKRTIGFAVDRHENGLVAVFVPWTPTPAAGNIEIVPQQRIHPLQASMGEVFDCLFQYGVGSSKFLGQLDSSNFDP